MLSLLIIADDFTGALDTGVKFAERGISSCVTTDVNYDFTADSGSLKVLICDTETRHIEAFEAGKRVEAVIRAFKNAGGRFVYKKTDSALRGNIGSELAAGLLSAPGRRLHFIPAFPAMNRTTAAGIHYINGVPVSESAFGKDPFDPVISSDIADIIHKQTDVQVVNIPSGEMPEKGRENIIAVYDAAVHEDIQRIAAKLKERGELEYLAGCAGFAEVLPQTYGFEEGEAKRSLKKGDFLVVCGSVNPITLAQLDYAQKNGFHRINLLPEQKIEREYFKSAEGEEELRRIYEEIKANPRCILDTNDIDDREASIRYAAERGMGTEEVRANISDTVGYIIERLLEYGLDSTMLLTGGDTLMGLMRHMNIKEIIPRFDIGSGSVVSYIYHNKKEYQIITKSGGFGAEDLMVRIAEKLN